MTSPHMVSIVNSEKKGSPCDWQHVQLQLQSIDGAECFVSTMFSQRARAPGPSLRSLFHIFCPPRGGFSLFLPFFGVW